MPQKTEKNEKIDEKNMPLLDHLIELQRRIIIS